MRSETTGTLTNSAYLRCWCHWSQLSLLHCSAGPRWTWVHSSGNCPCCVQYTACSLRPCVVAEFRMTATGWGRCIQGQHMSQVQTEHLQQQRKACRLPAEELVSGEGGPTRPVHLRLQSSSKWDTCPWPSIGQRGSQKEYLAWELDLLWRQEA